MQLDADLSQVVGCVVLRLLREGVQHHGHHVHQVHPAPSCEFGGEILLHHVFDVLGHCPGCFHARGAATHHHYVHHAVGSQVGLVKEAGEPAPQFGGIRDGVQRIGVFLGPGRVEEVGHRTHCQDQEPALEGAAVRRRDGLPRGVY